MTNYRNRSLRAIAAGLVLAATVAPAATAQRDQRRICVRMQMSGSRINREICRTQAEWDRLGGLPDE